MKSKSPYLSILLAKDQELEKVFDLKNEAMDERDALIAIKRQPLSSQTMKLIYGRDGTRIGDHSVNKKLKEWKAGYLKRKAKPKKYEPMLYFLDYLNGAGF